MTVSAIRRSRRTKTSSWSSRFFTPGRVGLGLGPYLVFVLILVLVPHCLLSVAQDVGGEAERTGQAVADLQTLIRTTTRESSISLTDGRRISLARKILETDSTNPVALTELGVHHAMNYRWYANFIAARQPVGGGLRGTMSKEFRLARRYFEAAIASDPAAVLTYRELVRLLIEEEEYDIAARLSDQLTRQLPDDPNGWLMRGLVAQRSGNTTGASEWFSQALARMAPEERSLFKDIALFITDDEARARMLDPVSFDEAYWFSRDPLYLTDENERWSDHMARLTYADLWYGSGSVNGWKTERGSLITRYGMPLADLTFTGVFSRYNVLDFGDFDFVFEDQTRGGHYTLYSPKASEGSSWDFDYVIKAGEMEINQPELYRLDIPQTDVETRIARFKGPEGRTDIYIQYALPWQLFSVPGLTADPDSRLGAFVTTRNGGVLARIIRAPSGEMTYNVELQPYETGCFHFKLEPGTYGTSVEYLSHDRSAYGTARDSLTIGAWQASSLAVSDVLLAAEVDLVEEEDGLPTEVTALESSKTIMRHGYRIHPDPFSSVAPDDDAMLYFEVYGLSVDARGKSRFRIEARIEENEDRGLVSSVFAKLTGRSHPSVVSVAFEGEGRGADVYRFFAVDLSKQSAGRHTLTLKATDTISGESVTTTRPIEIGDR